MMSMFRILRTFLRYSHTNSAKKRFLVKRMNSIIRNDNFTGLRETACAQRLMGRQS